MKIHGIRSGNGSTSKTLGGFISCVRVSDCPAQLGVNLANATWTPCKSSACRSARQRHRPLSYRLSQRSRSLHVCLCIAMVPDGDYTMNWPMCALSNLSYSAGCVGHAPCCSTMLTQAQGVGSVSRGAPTSFLKHCIGFRTWDGSSTASHSTPRMPLAMPSSTCSGPHRCRPLR